MIRAIAVIGEAANKVSDDIRAANINIPWKAIVGMRNRLIRAYFDVDTDRVWERFKLRFQLLTNLTALLDPI